MENLGNDCSLHQCNHIRAASPCGHSVGGGLAAGLWAEHSPRYLGVGELCVRKHEFLQCCELCHVLDGGGQGGALNLCFLPSCVTLG